MSKSNSTNNNLLLDRVQGLYQAHAEVPYISPDRDLPAWLEDLNLGKSRPVAKRQMIRPPEGLLPGHIILLRRVSLGTYTSDTWISKYFEYDYGINGQDIDKLVQAGYVRIQSATESLDLVTSPQLKAWLKAKGVKGYSKLNKSDLIQAVLAHYPEGDLADLYDQRRYVLTPKGQATLAANREIVDRHPKMAL